MTQKLFSRYKSAAFVLVMLILFSGQSFASDYVYINGSFKQQGTIGRSYSSSIYARGGKSSSYYWTKTSGTIPPGLTLEASGNRYYLQGIPTKSGTYTFSVIASDGYGNSSSSKNFTVIIPQPIINSYMSFKDGTVGKSYSSGIRASKGAAPYKWKVSSGKIPKGLKLDYFDDRCYLRNTPTKSGKYTFYLKATDYYGNVTKPVKFTVKISKPGITVNWSFREGTAGRSYSDFVSATGGTSPYKWKRTKGKLPPGLKIESSGRKCYLKGTPQKAGTYTFYLKATDKYGNPSKAEKFTLKIAPPVINSFLSFWDGTVGKSYSDYVTVSYGTAPYKWRVSSGKIPPGLNLDYFDNRCYLKGTPEKAGNYTFDLKATDRYGNATKPARFTITISKPVIDIYSSFRDGTVGRSYSDYIYAFRGTSPYTWPKISGTIPDGLSFRYIDNKCYLQGVPKKAGTYRFTLKAIDKYNIESDSSEFVIVIKASPYSSASNKVSGIGKESAKIAIPETGMNQNQVQNYGAGNRVYSYSGVKKAALKIIDEENILETGSGRDEDIVRVKANTPLKFEILDVDFDKISPEKFIVLYDFQPAEDILISDDGTFTLPAEMVTGDFVVSVHTETGNHEYESDELYIEAVSE